MTEHRVESACFMVPYVVGDIDIEQLNVHELDISELEDASNHQGFHRKESFVYCRCGAEFTGDGCFSELRDHIDTADEHAITEVDAHRCRDGSFRYDITFVYRHERYTVECWARGSASDWPHDDYIQVTFPEQLDSTSNMDEIVMEKKARNYIENAEEAR